MPVHVVCPACDTMLALQDAAPARVTCPRCLAPFDNPAAPRAGQAAPLPALPALAPISSIDRQFARDSTAGMWAVITTIGSIGAGIATLGFAMGYAGFGWMVVIGAIALCIVIFVVQITGRTNRATVIRTAPFAPPDSRPADGTLDYGRPNPATSFRQTPLGIILRILLGIVAAVTILVVVGVLILLSICAIAMKA